MNEHRETDREHSKRHIAHLKKLIAEYHPLDPKQDRWKEYLANYQTRLEQDDE